MIERIEAELVRSSWDLADSDPYVGVALPEAPKATPHSPSNQPKGSDPFSGPATFVDESSSTAPQTNGLPQAVPGMTEFRFVEGTSNRFWRVGVNGCDLIVEFGRFGTNGQRVIKTFDDEERAKREAVKLTLEKTRKGYQET